MSVTMRLAFWMASSFSLFGLLSKMGFPSNSAPFNATVALAWKGSGFNGLTSQRVFKDPVPKRV